VLKRYKSNEELPAGNIIADMQPINDKSNKLMMKKIRHEVEEAIF